MKHLLIAASIIALASCQTTETQTAQNDEIIVTASKTSGQNRVQPAPAQAVIAPVPQPIATAYLQGYSPTGQGKFSVQNSIAVPGVPNAALGDGMVLESLPPEYETVTETVNVEPQAVDYVVKPAEYETVTEEVVVQEASTELVTVPPTYEWVDGIVPGSSTEFVATPPVYETIAETVVTQEASTELVSVPSVYNADGSMRTPASTIERTIPAITKQVTRRVVKTPASTTERVVPNVIKDGRTRVQKTAGRTIERPRPPVTKMETRRKVKVPAVTEQRMMPATTKEVTRRKQTRAQRYVIRNRDGKIVREFASQDEFAKYQNNPYKRVADSPVSTFSADVDTASYSFTRQYVQRGQRPPAGSVRVEEMINYFDYDYDVPRSKEAPFKPNITVMPSPWNAETKLVHIGIKGYDIPDRKRPPMNLVFLIDVSGSMKADNKLPLLKRSFETLVKNLNKDDKVSIVTYGPTVETVLIPTSGNRKPAILDAIAPLEANGGTAGAAGLQTAYRVAEQAFNDEGTNRVILATDGDFNIGISDPAELKTFIEDKRESDIYLSVLGFGQGNVKDNRMQAMAQNGNGTAGYIDSLREARKFFDRDMGKNLFPIADDVKIQVEFNPALVSEYRLIGYETRALKRQDFNNDKVDAGDIGAGHTVTAIYEINPVGSGSPFVDPLRYETKTPKPSKTAFNNEYGFVKLRYKLPGEKRSRLISEPISKANEYNRFDRAPVSARWATVVGAYGLKLRGDGFMQSMDWSDITQMAQNARGRDKNGYRSEFIELTRDAGTIGEY